MGARRGMRAKKPQLYPLRYSEDFFAKHDEVAAQYRIPQQQKLLRLVLIIGLIWCCAVVSGVCASADEQTEKLDKQAYELYQQVFSPFCPGRSLNDCPSSKAHELKVQMRQKLEEGVPSQTVLEEVFAKFGDQYRAVPSYNGVGKLVWWVPLGFVFLGLGVALAVGFGRKKNETASQSSLQPILNDEVKAQIEHELSSFD